MYALSQGMSNSRQTAESKVSPDHNQFLSTTSTTNALVPLWLLNGCFSLNMDGMANYDPLTCSACRRSLVKTTEVFACGSIRGLLILLEQGLSLLSAQI